MWKKVESWHLRPTEGNCVPDTRNRTLREGRYILTLALRNRVGGQVFESCGGASSEHEAPRHQGTKSVGAKTRDEGKPEWNCCEYNCSLTSFLSAAVLQSCFLRVSVFQSTVRLSFCTKLCRDHVLFGRWPPRCYDPAHITYRCGSVVWSQGSDTVCSIVNIFEVWTQDIHINMKYYIVWKISCPHFIILVLMVKTGTIGLKSNDNEMCWRPVAPLGGEDLVIIRHLDKSRGTLLKWWNCWAGWFLYLKSSAKVEKFPQVELGANQHCTDTLDY